MDIIRWGILSTGNIANEFVEGLADLPGTEVVAVGSRTRAAAEDFGVRWNVPNRHASYEELVADPDVDVIYIGTPHPFHPEHAILALEAGKHVLCEKPFAMTRAQGEAVMAVAAERGLFMMEALWTLFLPHIAWLREFVAGGGIGELRMVQADFGFRTDFDPQHRLFDPELGGGALLDVGLYPLALAQSLLGSAAEVSGYATIGSTGVDEEVALSLRYRGGQLASVTAATRLDTPNEAWLLGTEGRVRIHREWWRPSTFTIIRGGSEEVLEIRADLPGHNYQALEVNRCLREGLTESPVVPWNFTRSLAATLDVALAQ